MYINKSILFGCVYWLFEIYLYISFCFCIYYFLFRMSVNQIAPLLHYDVKDMKHLFVSATIRIFGAGMIGVFVPLIIYNMWTHPRVWLNLVFVFFALSSLFTLFLDIFVSVPFIHKRGTKISMIIWIIALLVYQNVFIVFEWSQLLRYVAPLFISLFTAFFWPAFHFNIAHTQKTKTFGHQIAKLNIIVTIALALWSLLWWYMLDFWGILPTVILANIFVVVSIVPLLLSSQPHKDNFLEYTPNISREIISFLYAQRKIFWSKRLLVNDILSLWLRCGLCLYLWYIKVFLPSDW